MRRFIVFSLFLLCTATLSASPMVRVIGIRDSRTIVVDREGVAQTITLAATAVPPSEGDAATEYLRRTLESSWVMVETDSNGESYVYRSPDALYVNGELARRAWAGSSVHMTYVGEAMPAPARTSRISTVKSGPSSFPPPPRPHAVRHHPKGAHRIPHS